MARSAKIQLEINYRKCTEELGYCCKVVFALIVTDAGYRVSVCVGGSLFGLGGRGGGGRGVAAAPTSPQTMQCAHRTKFLPMYRPKTIV
jgi:hypothetical protein